MADNQNNNQNNGQNNKNNKRRFSFGSLGILIIAALFIFGIIYSVRGCSVNSKEISYTEGIGVIYNYSDKIKDITVTPANDSSKAESYRISLNYKDKSIDYFYINNSEVYANFVKDVQNRGIALEYKPGANFNPWTLVIYGSLAIAGIVLVVIISRSVRQIGNQNNSTMEFTKSRAKLNKMSTTKFNDVAGCEEEKQELVEIVDFLKDPKKYTDMGARVPKGVLLYGEPGTGKTLLARAVAGEAGVPFFYTTGSDLVEMYVGVGAGRVRDMFKTAKKHAPSILFMDEIDAIGRARGTGLGGGNDEREQTLNQLLVEMDGFGQNTGIIVIAATNRVDILDPALMRPGRFDRQINVSVPDIKGREEILKVHARNKKISKDLDFNQIAHQTPGFTGADLENVMNEAALLAARNGKKEIDNDLVGEAIDRVMMGPAKKSRVISQKEKNVIAYHEAGHCVIGTLLSNADQVTKVTIIPRGQAGGYNLMGPKDEETFLHTKSQLYERITGLLGGRTAEELIFGEITTGASNDMEKATAIARSMVTQYGMSKLGPITYEKNAGYSYLGRDYSEGKNFSDIVAHEIDEEVRLIISDCHNTAAKVLTENIDKLKAVAHYLMETETLYKVDIDEIMSTGKLKRVDEKSASKSTLNDLGEETTSTESDNTTTENIEDTADNNETR